MKHVLPQSIELSIHIEADGGFWIEFPDLPGCYTQGDSLAELPSQVEDALLTYFDVPRVQARKIHTKIALAGTGRLEPVLG